MSQTPNETRPRILIVDDNPAIHEDFQKILGPNPETNAHLDTIEAELFGQPQISGARKGFRIDSAHQGREALELVQKAMQDGDPYVLAFVDVRMPPGWDGIETLEHIWQCAPELQAVICTAYSDYSWDDMLKRFSHTDNLLILKKPFETIEVLQLVHALTRKFELGRQAKLRLEDLDRMVGERTEQLVLANENLKHEVEERICAERSLRDSEERFSTAFQSNPNPMAILRAADRCFVDANQSFLNLCGRQREQLSQHTDVELQLWRKKKDHSEAFLPNGHLRDHSCFLRRTDDDIRQIVLAAEPLSIASMPCLLLIVEDVTDRVKLETELRQAQKMEVIGRLAAGVAHEFNNVLTIIQGNVGLLQIPNAPALDRTVLLDQVMHASRRAAAFTKQLLAFSRKQVLQPRPLNLSSAVRRTQKMLFQLIGERFEIQLRCPEELPAILADEAGIDQILINLVINARDAMVEGGLIEIITEAVELDADAARFVPESRPGTFVCLSVKDHGCGMETQLLTRIFDPFFTTKEVGKGTGLGLSTIHGIVKQHDGWINVASKVGRGTTFKIFFPTSQPHSGSSDGTHTLPAQSIIARGQGETVLVVEDEEQVRNLCCAALQKCGYHTLEAADGPHAIKIWEQHADEVSLLLTDMVMPSGMSGGVLAKILLSKNPKLRVIYTSGCNTEFLRRDSLLAKGINFLPKPYDVPALLNAVRVGLDGGKLPRHETSPGNREFVQAS